MSDHTTNDPAQEIPCGYCQCGCGQKTSIANQTHTKLGWTKGQPVRFVVGHHNKVRELRPLEERFWEKVNKKSPEECWEWTAVKNLQGYGNIHIGSKTDGSYRTLVAHRVSWEMHYGPIPDGLCVLHRCDNPACVNPNHLSLGTQLENIQDMLNKGRESLSHPRPGEENGFAKLTTVQVLEIRQRAAQGESMRQIAKEFGTDYTNVWLIVRRKAWKHV
jgi:hypothetical protein